MDLDALIRRHDRRVPRYTSYPTAPHFAPSVTGAVLAGWLAALPRETPLSLYLHVPFCETLCLFCGCHTAVVRGEGPRAAYGEMLRREIALVADRLGGRRTVRHVHWGGGTPTALSAASLRVVMDELRARFDVTEDAEIAVELDPRILPGDRVEALAAMGVTRASLGVQDFDPRVQQAVGRIQSYETTLAAAERLRAVGVRSINLDLLYGLPHQTEAGAAETARRALGIAPDRVAVFGYAHVPWMKRHQALLPEEALPDARARFLQRAAIEAVLTGAGFRPIGLDHYARPDDALAVAEAEGRLRRNFQGYTTDDAPALIGLGASAIGALPQGYAQNAPRVPDYAAALREGRLPTARGVALSAEDRLRREVIESLMCRLSADLPALAARHGMNAAALLAGADAALRALEADGLVRREGGRVEVTEAGRPFVRNAAAAFDAYLRPEATPRHARAI